MKLHKKLLLFGAGATLLTGCAENDEESAEAEEDNGPETEEVEDEESEDTEEGLEEAAEIENGPEQQPGDVIEAEGGNREIIAVNYDIDETLEDGPFEVVLKHAQLSQFEPKADMKEYFESDSLAMVTLKMEVTNDSEDTNSIYPDQGTMVTDTGQQVEAEMFLSDDVGGDFHGEVTKDGDIFFFFDGEAKDIKNVRFIIGAGHDENIESFDGEDLEFSIDF